MFRNRKMPKLIRNQKPGMSLQLETKSRQLKIVSKQENGKIDSQSKTWNVTSIGNQKQTAEKNFRNREIPNLIGIEKMESHFNWKLKTDR